MRVRPSSPSSPPGGGSSVLPSWRVNLALFGVLVLLVLGGFFFQLSRINQGFRQHALEHSRLLAEVIEGNLRNSFLIRRTVDEVIHSFFNNSARFVEYLDTVEPFSSEELQAYAQEAGLAGITIVHPPAPPVSGPPGWLPGPPGCGRARPASVQPGPGPLVYYIHPQGGRPDSCVILGLDGARIKRLRQRTSPRALIEAMSALPGIRYLRIAPGKEQEASSARVRLLREDGAMVAETCIPLRTGTLVLGLDARPYVRRVQALRHQFLLFGALLICLGLFFSWLLYRYQQRDLERTRHMERALAREREAAALGRATATIAHEVRNPLNAIHMGLQRLALEWDDYSPEQRELIEAMVQAVRRADGIVGELRRFTRPLRAAAEPVAVHEVLAAVLAPYQGRTGGMEVNMEVAHAEPVPADAALLAEMFDNLVKNAAEAQPGGGYLHVRIGAQGSELVIDMENGGFALSPEDSARMGEPYFTSKTRGTGLGLALARKIAEAHGGGLGLYPDHNSHSLRITIRLPRAKEEQ